MISIHAFKTLIDFITGHREQVKQDHMEFLKFFEDLVRLIPEDLAKEFGRVSAPTLHNGAKRAYQIELTVTDLMWWRTIIYNDNGRFVDGPVSIQRDIWDHINSQVKTHNLSDEQRLKLLAILDTDEEAG